MKKVIVISTSLRAGSNSDMLADKFIEGALKSGNDVEKISLIDKDIRFCRGCLACQKLGKCVINDDVNDIIEWTDEGADRPYECHVRIRL